MSALLYALRSGRNVSKFGVPTLRPLWWEFPNDMQAADPATENQFMLGVTTFDTFIEG